MNLEELQKEIFDRLIIEDDLWVCYPDAYKFGLRSRLKIAENIETLKAWTNELPAVELAALIEGKKKHLAFSLAHSICLYEAVKKDLE